MDRNVRRDVILPTAMELLLLLFLPAGAKSAEKEELAAARVVFEKNLEAIRNRDRNTYGDRHPRVAFAMLNQQRRRDALDPGEG